MSQTHEIKAESRKDEGKGASRRLRRALFVPAVVYGGKPPPQSIQIEHNTILLAAKHEWFFSSVLDLNIDGTVQKVLVRDWRAQALYGQSQALVPVGRLLDGGYITPCAGRMRLFALQFAAPEVIYADGVEVGCHVAQMAA